MVPAAPAARDDAGVPITFAHRGARADERENTLPAFRRALDAGARGLESDAWLAGDGEVVLVHDPVVWRGLRRRRIGRTSSADLAAIEVPRLTDLYDDCGTAYELSLDVKEERAAEPVLDAARAHEGAVGRLWICTPSLRLLGRLRAVEPRVRLVHSRRKRALEAPLERHASELAGSGIDAMNMHHTDWTAGLVALFHRFGVKAFAWDVQEVRHLRAVLTMGVDAVYSDHVERMVATVAEWSLDEAP